MRLASMLVKAQEPAKVAALPIPDAKPQPATPEPQVLARALQTELKRVDACRW